MTREHPVVTGYRDADSAGAVQLGELLAGTLREPLVLAAAYRYEPAAFSAAGAPSIGNERRLEAAQDHLAAIRPLVHEAEVRERVVPADDIADAIVDLARDEDAAVIVLGRDLRGDVTSDVLHRARCPVAVAPITAALPGQSPLERVGVAYDRSPVARLALAAGAQLAAAARGRLEILAAGPDADRDHLEQTARSVGRGIPVTWRILDGHPDQALLAAAGDLDLLACGSRGHSRVISRVLGSVSSHLISAAECPVLVVPPRVRRDTAAPLGVTTADGPQTRP